MTDASDPLIPPIGVLPPAERLFRVNWVTQLGRSPAGVPLMPAEFVARQGRGVHIVDIREPDELTGALGHIPGAEWIPRERVASLATRLDRDTPVVLVSRAGERAAEAARSLELAGMRMVAALEGGIVSWKNQGYATTREADILGRRDVLRAPIATASGDAELTVERIERHLGDPASVRFLKVAALLLHGRVSCVDGRDDSGVVGTLGGDAGEFLLLLAAIESVSGKRFSHPEVRALFARRLDVFGRFYMHTDITAGNAVIASMRADRRLDAALANVSEAVEWRAFWASPPPEVREIVLEHALVPARLGCGHLRLAWQNPERYGVRAELTESFVRAMLVTRWNGAIEAEYIPLAGGHAERAVLRVFVDQPIEPYSLVPLVSPSCDGVQTFVCHPQVVGFLRRQLVSFAERQIALVPRMDFAALAREIERLGQQQMDATLGVLAKGLPIFDVTQSPGTWNVELAGRVPG